MGISEGLRELQGDIPGVSVTYTGFIGSVGIQESPGSFKSVSEGSGVLQGD